MKVKEIANVLEAFAPIQVQEGYDNSGLLIGDFNSEVKKVLVCLDVTVEVIEEAVREGANMIVAHHPIIFAGLKRLTGENYVEQTVMEAIKNDINIYACHTNLDKIKGGVSYKMADLLGLDNLEILSQETEDVGLGVMGNLPEAIAPNAFLKLVKEVFGGTIRHTKLPAGKVQKVALCGGSGASFLAVAKEKRADVYLSSDFKYHQFFDAEDQIVILDIGHAEAENCSKALINEILSKKFPNFAVYLSKIDTNPIKYY